MFLKVGCVHCMGKWKYWFPRYSFWWLSVFLVWRVLFVVWLGWRFGVKCGWFGGCGGCGFSV